MCADEERNAMALKMARSTVAQGEQVLLFSHRVEHARTLDRMLVSAGIPSGTLLGGVENEVAFARTKDALKRGEYRAAVGTYQAIAQGLDLPSVSRGICTTPIGNNRQQFGQVRGRICRSATGKTIGRLGYLLDTAVYGTKPVRNFLQWGHGVRVWTGREWLDGAAWLEMARMISRGGIPA
jgi:superfamily II DNA or RNA helicase